MKGVDLKELDRVFTINAVVCLLVALLAFPFDTLWAGRYALFSVLATVNWIALSRIISGAFNAKPLELIYGIMAKPLLLALLLAAAVNGSLEVTSFLAAMNTFFVVLLIYVARRQAASPKAPGIMEGVQAHG